MASLVSWLSKSYDQVNPFDNGRTWKQRTPTNTNSVIRQTTHNGVTDAIGGGVVKPLIRGGLAVDQGITNIERKIAGRPTLNTTQFLAQPGLSGIGKFSEYRGTKRQILGDAASNIVNVAFPGSSKLLESAAAKLLPKGVHKLIPRAMSSSLVGIPTGSIGNVASYVASEQPITPQGIGTSALQGAIAGGIGGPAVPLVGAGAKALYKGTAKGAQAVADAGLPKTYRLGVEDRRALSDFTDYLAGNSGYQPKPSEINRLTQQVMDIGRKSGLDVTSGTPRDRYLRIGDFLENFDANKAAIKQGGYIGRRPSEGDMPRGTQMYPDAEQRVFDQNPLGPGAAKPAIGDAKPPQLPTFKTKRVGAIDKAARSTRSIIERQGKSGQELAGMLQGSRDTQELYLAQLQKTIPTLRKLKGSDFENFVDSTQGLAKPASPKIAQAVTEWQAAHPGIRDRAVAAGLDVGDLGNTYYPHFIDYEKVFKDTNTYNQAINHLVETGQAKTSEEAIQLLSYARDVSRNRQFGNLEASRLVDLPFYDKTPNSLISYLGGSAKRIAQTETFGNKDQKALNLIKKIGLEGGDTEAAKNAYDIAVGAKQYNPSTSKVSRTIRQYVTTTRLGLGALTNVSQNVNTGIVTGHLRTMKAALKQLDPKTRAFVQDTGVIADAVLNDLRVQKGDTFSQKVLGKALQKITAPGFNAVEKMNRSIAATAGRDYALRLAQKGNEKVLRKLGVTGEIKNGTLTEAQQIQAARKVVEKTQFKVDPQDLPGWTDSPGGKLVAQFRTFSYNQGKFVSNEILKPAAKGNFLPLGRLLAALPVGYGLYELKRKIGGRPEEENKTKVGLQTFQNVGGAGLAFDLYQSLNPVGSKYLSPDRRQSMATGAIGGPAVGIATQGLGAISETVQRKNTPTDESRLEGKVVVGKTPEDYTDLTAATRFGLQQIPIVGTPIKNRLLPYKQESNADAGKTDNPSAPAQDETKTKAELKRLKDSPPSGYSMKKLGSEYAYTLNDGKLHTGTDKEKVLATIEKDRFDKSGANYKLVGDTVYRRSASGAISTTPKTQFDYQVGKATLTQQKNSGDFGGWLQTANKQLANINKQLQDPATDPLDSLTLQNEAQTLLAAMSRYQGYGGFSKAKSAAKKAGVAALTSSFRTASGAKAPSLPKITPRKPTAFKAPSVRKLAVSKIPTSYINRKRTV